jgi:hypothetical protein
MISSRIDQEKQKELFWSVVANIFEIYYEQEFYDRIRGNCRIMVRGGRIEELQTEFPELYKKIIELWKKSNENLKKEDDLLKKELERGK